jgi:hypothetical protein
MERVRQRYAVPMPKEVPDPSPSGEEGQDPRRAIDAAFDHLVARIQAAHFDHRNPSRRKEFQRLVERLRRAQCEIPVIQGWSVRRSSG